jgi:hypothetical protein
VLLFILGLLGASAAHAADAPHPDSHVRTTNREIAALINQATHESALFRSLIARLNASDVVVYVETARTLPYTRDGQLTFLGTGGGIRYVVVSLAWGRPEVRVMATLGHELQHAVEIAGDAAIVDSPSLAKAYAGFGVVTIHGSGRTYDTRAARRAGEQVHAELLHATRKLAMLEPAPDARP